MASTKSGRYLRSGVLLFLLVAALWFKFVHEPDYKRPEKPYDTIEGDFTGPPLVRKPYAYVPPDTSATHGVDRALWAAPASNWLKNEKKDAEAAIAGNRATLLIVPVQGDTNAFAPVQRSLITRLISNRVAADDDNAVLPPSAVFRYFGAHQATYSDDDIKWLSKRTQSLRILVLHAQHDREGTWELKASLHDHDFTKVLETKTWAGLTYTDAEPPWVALEEIVEDVVEFATGDSSRQRQKKYKFDADEFQFPDSVEDLVARSNASPLHTAAYLQLLGTLHPRDRSNETRNRLFERSIVELQRVSPRSPYYRYFMARAYTGLGRRPAALSVLGKPQNVHESALLDYLNGNLPDLRQHTSAMDTSALDYMSWKDLYQLESTYDQKRDRDTIERLSNAHPVWSIFIFRSLQGFGTWASPSMSAIKFGLEGLLPVPDVSLMDRLSKLAATGEGVGDLGELELTRLVWRHIEAVKSAATPNWKGAEVASYNSTVNDILDLVKEVAVSNHLRRVNMDLSMRHLPEPALRKIAEFESLFSGHPAVTLLKGRAQQKMAKDSLGSEKENLDTAAADSLLNGFAWTGRMTQDAAAVARHYGELLVKSSYDGPRITKEDYLSTYSRRYFEWPRDAAWYYRIAWREGEEDAFERCMAYSPTTFQCLVWEIKKQQRNAEAPDAIRAELLAANAHRYGGHPSRSSYEVEVLRASADEQAETDLLKKQIESGATNWAPYKALGRLLAGKGDYQEARDVWLSYPGFQPASTISAITRDHCANYAGSELFWIGQHDLATPLLAIAASSRTGSGGQMSAAQRLALIDGDLDAAEYWAAERVRRYRDKYGLRDLLQLLHIRGQSDLAWSVFDEVQATTQDSQMWSGALIGHRISSATITDIVAWLQSSETRKSAVADERRGTSVDLAPRYLLLAGTMDRVPGPALTKIVSDAHTRVKPRYMHRRPYVDENGELETILHARVSSYAGHAQHDELIPTPRDERRVGQSEEIENRYTMLARAMVAFLNNDFESAFELFNETAYFYLLDEYLPYHVFGAAVLGRTEHLVAALDARESKLKLTRQNEKSPSSNDGYRFDEDLAYAVLAAFDGDHEGAIGYLENALNNRPYINDRTIYPMYQVVDLAERLYERTGEDAYARFALDLSRRHTTVLPMYAWAHYVVATHSPSMPEKISATASGLKLDPLSERAKSLPAEVLTKARELLEEKGAPFLVRPEEQRNETTRS